jgi:hypothetical protein
MRGTGLRTRELRARAGNDAMPPVDPGRGHPRAQENPLVADGQCKKIEWSCSQCQSVFDQSAEYTARVEAEVNAKLVSDAHDSNLRTLKQTGVADLMCIRSRAIRRPF